MDTDETVISRGDTGIRLLYTILFLIIRELLKTLTGLVVLFELLFTLITKQAPSERVTRFAHQVVWYSYVIGRYITYNQEEPPFPFADFPEAPRTPD